MSILIKGAEMPNCCQNCPMGVASDGGYYIDCVLTEKSILDPIWPELRNRPDWCPLVPVPTPHGRLIDVDKADDYAYDELEVSMSYRTGWEAARAMQKIYQSVPTVVEAEE